MNKQGKLLTAMCTFIFAAGFIGTPFAVFADTVVLRSGRKFTNVKTRLTKGRIIITDRRGRVRRYRARDIKLMLPGKVNWKAPTRITPPKRKPVKRPPPRKVIVKKEPVKKPPPKKDPPKVVVKNPVLPRTANNTQYPSKWQRTRDSLLPFWSGFYGSGRTNFGLFFTGLEIYAVAALLPWLSQATPFEQDNPAFLLGVAAALPPPPPPPGAGMPPPPEGAAALQQNILRAQPLMGQIGLVSHPRTGGMLQRAAHNARRNQLIGGAVVVLLTHAALAYFIEPPAAPPAGNTAARPGSLDAQGDLIFALDTGLTRSRDDGPPTGRGLKLGYALRF